MAEANEKFTDLFSLTWVKNSQYNCQIVLYFELN